MVNETLLRMKTFSFLKACRLIKRAIIIASKTKRPLEAKNLSWQYSQVVRCVCSMCKCRYWQVYDLSVQ